MTHFHAGLAAEDSGCSRWDAPEVWAAHCGKRCSMHLLRASPTLRVHEGTGRQSIPKGGPCHTLGQLWLHIGWVCEEGTWHY
jgi:hypothetical protein